VSASLIACKNQEPKKNEASSDPESGTFTSLDEKSAVVKAAIEAYVAGKDSAFIYDHYVDTVKVVDLMANNDDNDKSKPTISGKVEVMKGTLAHHSLFSDIKMPTDNIKTFVNSNGSIVTCVWTWWSATGKYSKKHTNVFVHLAYFWSGDKMTKLLRVYDPTTLKEEIAASQKTN
jgi:hypothetical protein